MNTSISDDLVQRFLAQPNFNAKCQVCGTNAWHRLKEPLHGLNYLIGHQAEAVGFRGLEVVVIYCTSCGNVRQHAAHLIRDWGDKNG